jgi:hypothetical protein
MPARRLVLALCVLAVAGALPPLLLGAPQGEPIPDGEARFQVNYTGDGSGTVSGSGLNGCSYNGSVESGDCQTTQPVGGSEGDLVFTANAAPGSTFENWLGECDEEFDHTCVIDKGNVTAGDTVTVTAFFSSQQRLLTVSTTAGGKVTGVGINCGDGATDCTHTFPNNTLERLTATPMTGYVFVRWEGDCAAFLSNVCDLVVNAAKTVRAVFAQGTFPVVVTPPVGGMVASSPGGISCGGAATTLCSANFTANTQVQLTATPMAGYRFVRWEGDCATVEILVCVVQVNKAISVAVVFVKVTPKCKCKDLTVTAPKREFGSAEGRRSDGSSLTRFFLSLDWRLRCTAGTGNNCRGTLTFQKPDGFRNVHKWRIVRSGGRTTRVPDPGPVTCNGPCRLNQSTITNGTVRVNMDSNRTFDQLAGRSFEFKVTTRCAGEATTYVFTVSMGANGRINRVSRSIEI